MSGVALLIAFVVALAITGRLLGDRRTGLRGEPALESQ
jgi:hypothetical protein